MPKAELFTAYWPGWLSLSFAALLVLNKFIEESATFAKAFGRLGRWLHTRALERHHVDLAANQFAAAVQKAVEQAREEWEQDENEALASLDRRLATVSRVTGDQERHIHDLLETQEILKTYGEYEGLWHNALRAAAAEGNGTIHLHDLPEHITLYAFESRYRRDPKWRQWIDL